MAKARTKASDDEAVLFDTDQVDLVAVSDDNQTAILVIVRAAPWTGSDPELDSLQMKVHNYVTFAIDGAMVDQFPETVGLGWRIQLDSQGGKPDRRTAAFLTRLAQGVVEHGGTLEVRVWATPDHP